MGKPSTKFIIQTGFLKDRPVRPPVDFDDNLGDDLRLDAAGQDSTNAHHVGVDESLEDVR